MTSWGSPQGAATRPTTRCRIDQANQLTFEDSMLPGDFQLRLPPVEKTSVAPHLSSPLGHPLRLVVLESACFFSEGSDQQASDPPRIAHELLRAAGHDVTSVILTKGNAPKILISLLKEKFDCWINLCDGAWDEDRAGADVIELLEKFDVPFTGGNSSFYDPSRKNMKAAAISVGEKTPAWRFVWQPEDISCVAQALTFPMIVKHHHGYCSVGMTKNSLVYDEESLTLQCELMMSSYGGALVEEYIAGREFTVLVSENPKDPTEPLVFSPVECGFPPGEEFKHFDLKWHSYSDLMWWPVVDEDLAERLRDMARKVFVALRGRGFGRIDVRGDKDCENLYFLEINPNCGIFYPKGSYGSADEILRIDPTTDHTSFLHILIECAMNAHRRNQPSYHAQYSKGSGFGLFALRDFAKGETVQRNEEKPTVIVSRQHVDATFSAAKMIDFNAYAYPLSENVFVTWHDDPDMWEPINHSCDPNTWLVGLNTVARRVICKGEELTIDYSTFTFNCASFKCMCGSENCRGTVTGSDWAIPELARLYRGHVSDFVHLKQIELQEKSESPHCDRSA